MSNLVSRLRDSDALNLLLRYNPLATSRIAKLAQRYAAADGPGRRRIRERLLETTIRNARRTRYGAQFTDAVDDWPILDKSTLRDNVDDFRGPGRVAIEAGTGGTTGQPIKLFRSLSSIAIERFFIEELVRPLGLSLRRSKVAILRADEIKDPQDAAPPYGVHRLGRRHLILSNPHLNADTVAWYVGAIRQHRTDILYVYPSMLENLMNLAAQASLPFQVPIVLSSSETVAPALFKEVKDRLGATLVDYYGLGERVAFAAVGQDGAYYFNPLYGRTELIDLGEQSDEGQSLYRVVATGYWNDAMPLVRYDTGDIAMVRPQDRDRLREIENGERSFAGILGRRSEYIVGPDGSRISGLNHLPRGVSNLVRMQVVQLSPGVVEIRLRTGPAFDERDREQLQANIDAMVPPSISIEIRDNVEFDKAPNGKTPFVIRNE